MDCVESVNDTSIDNVKCDCSWVKNYVPMTPEEQTLRLVESMLRIYDVMSAIKYSG
jgi:hypothetical protein